MPNLCPSRRASATLCLALVLCLVGCASPRSTTVTATATVTATPTAPPTATLAPGTLQVSDPATARQLSFAFAQNNDVWVSWHGQPPQQVTHLGLGAQALSWWFVWSTDQTKLLAVAQPGQVAQGWVITLPAGTVLPLPATSLFAEGTIWAWIGDRYVVYVFRGASHARAYNVYDTQTQRALATTLSSIQATEMEVRGASVYFTDYYASSGPGPGPTPGIVRRWDMASNTITTAFTVPVMLVAQGLPAGSWNLSADASRIISACFTPPCSVYLQDTSGTTTTIFRAQYPTGSFAISPDGTYAAGTLGGTSGQAPALVQQALPSGPELTNARPGSCQDISPMILGWAASPAGILVEDDLVDARNNPTGVRICEAPVGTAQPAHVVETVSAEGAVVFAPPGS